MKQTLLILFLGILFTTSPLALAADFSVNNPVITLQEEDEKVALYPNPAKEFTHIKVNSDDVKITEVLIYGILGNQMFHKSYSGDEKEVRLDIQKFKKGKYLIKVVFEDGTTEVKPLIKE